MNPSGAPISTDSGELAALMRIQGCRDLMHSHPWVDVPGRKQVLRRMVLEAINRVREHRAEKERRRTQPDLFPR